MTEPATLDDWTAAVEAALGLAPGTVDTDAVLDLVREVAHGVMRPAGPIAAYLVGYAAGAARTDPHDGILAVEELVNGWESP
ncbi:DUF6457 domain-containing protein [Demequina capsici]|uniref:DUF6457 domain-containing protein n=1 Tax=Demequina capsici TaxID=3075620 RepID=A0AA96FBA6_9MICO|nr:MULTISPECIES: DUF6457 domain-containing protein [unclassified Demequina]WNM25451.1 DUF6457 domain-containing protein [Demequina sp. OYTSA14]WNM28332.1 DUF6457 domain-containing protein [Demequina sp. PMTSA13]